VTGSDLLGALLGVAAAACFTASFALQQRANLIAMAGDRRGAAAVMGQPWWIAGIGLQPVAFAFQAFALGVGAFAVVQPALVTQLVFMVPAGAWVVHRRPSVADLWAPIVVLVGLVVFELAARPTGGRDVAPFEEWVGPLLVVLAAFAASFAAGQALPAYRAALRGAAAGIWGGAIAAFANQLVAVGADGPGALVANWAAWALVVAGIVNFAWVNLALRAGRLASSVATMSALGAAVSVFLAVTVFDEASDAGTVGRSVAVAGAVVCAIGIALVARSPSLLALEAGTAPGGPGGRTLTRTGRNDAGQR
jgi:hypothetical protein